MMLVYALAAALVAAPLDYQVQTFVSQGDGDGNQTGTLQPSELSCVASRITNYHPDENAVDVLWVDYVREYRERTNVCVRWAVERSEPVEEYIQREAVPEGVRFSADGSTVYFRDVLSPSCRPRGQTTALAACLASYLNVPGQVTQLSMRRNTTSDPMVLRFAWELVSREPDQYAQDRRNRVARSHVKEIPPEPEPEPGPVGLP